MTSPSGSEPACERFRVPLTRRSPAPRSSFARGTLRPPALTRTRDVLPAPPLGGAPRLRSFTPANAQGGHVGGPRRRRSRSTSRSAPRGVGHLLWGFAPRRTCSWIRADETRGLDALRELNPFGPSRPTSASPRDRALRRRSTTPSLLAPRHTLLSGGLSPARPAPRVGFVSVAELGTAPR